MKKLMIAMLVIAMVSSASAQKVAVSYRPVNTAAFIRPHTLLFAQDFIPITGHIILGTIHILLLHYITGTKAGLQNLIFR